MPLQSLPGHIQEHLTGYHVAPGESDLVTNWERISSSFPLARRHDLSGAAFHAWIEEADYENAGPAWWSQFSTMYERKMLEHYASIELAGLVPGGTYMDAAASASPFYQVIRRTHGVAMCYRQDLNRRPGVHGDTIGSDASNIPLPDASLDGIVSHNSWEHFEGDSAFGFIKESARLLRRGGKLCILPLAFRARTEIWTSPSCWATKYVNAKELPRFDPAAAIVIKEEIVQRQIMWWKPSDLAERLTDIPQLKFEVVLVVCDNVTMYALVGTRV